MFHQNVNLNEDHRKTNDEVNGHQNPATNTSDDSEAPQNLSDINIDCLESIFMYLSLNDLIDIHHTTKTFQRVAELVFARKYGSKTIILNIQAYQNAKIKIADKVEIVDLKTSLRLLRSFGHLISRLEAQSSLEYIKNCNILNIYINEYCADSLKSFRMIDMRSSALDGMQKSFTKVAMVQLVNCSLDQNWQHFNRWFPNMKMMALSNTACISMRFPHLESLMAFGNRTEWSESENMDILKMNPQLQHLILAVESCGRFFRNSIKYLQSIEYLQIGCCTFAFDELDDDEIHLEKLKRLNLSTFNRKDSVELTQLPILAKKLEEFAHVNKGIELKIDLIDFLMKHPSIRKLNCSSNLQCFENDTENGENLMKITKALPLLDDMEFLSTKFKANEVFRFIGECKNLKKCKLNLATQSELDKLKIYLGLKWQMRVTNGEYVELERLM